jgi:hypothetical protein
VALKGAGNGGWRGEALWGCWVLWPCVYLGVLLLSGGLLCKELQGAVGVYSWYNRLVSGW